MKKFQDFFMKPKIWSQPEKLIMEASEESWLPRRPAIAILQILYFKFIFIEYFNCNTANTILKIEYFNYNTASTLLQIKYFNYNTAITIL